VFGEVARVDRAIASRQSGRTICCGATEDRVDDRIRDAVDPTAMSARFQPQCTDSLTQITRDIGVTSMRPVLRSLSGGHPGAAFPVRERTTLGRAALADIQLVDASVSRFHALIETQADGRHAIADLDSKAGIVVDGSPVRRAVLQVGTVVEICGFALRYEFVEDDVHTTLVPKVNGFVAVRQTHREVRMAEAPANDDNKADTQVVGERSPNASQVQSPEWLALLRDIVDARELRDRGDIESPRARALADRFAEPTMFVGRRRSRRAGRRHSCRTPVLVGLRRGPDVVTLVGFMIDAGIDGARICTEEALHTGTQCWLLVATGESERGGIAFSTRTVWSDSASGQAGMSFVGRPVAGDVLPALHTR
jgi:pSer/pThr/pTyr-binding forkhead associated (FHA) protein